MVFYDCLLHRVRVILPQTQHSGQSFSVKQFQHSPAHLLHRGWLQKLQVFNEPCRGMCFLRHFLLSSSQGIARLSCANEWYQDCLDDLFDAVKNSENCFLTIPCVSGRLLILPRAQNDSAVHLALRPRPRQRPPLNPAPGSGAFRYIT